MTENNWILLRTQYSGFCTECKGIIETKEECLWCQGIGVKHQTCPKKETQQELIQEEIVKNDFSSWYDPKQYTYTELQKIKHCQKNGCAFNGSCWIEDGRKTCEKCH